MRHRLDQSDEARDFAHDHRFVEAGGGAPVHRFSDDRRAFAHEARYHFTQRQLFEIVRRETVPLHIVVFMICSIARSCII